MNILSKDIGDTVVFFQRAIQITMALALGESFKQFVADESRTTIFVEINDKSSKGEHVHLERIPALITFVCIIVPFFQGMSREFYYSYLRDGIVFEESYPSQLIQDSLAFLAESALFFIMSRAIGLSRLPSFIVYIIALMFVDIVWTLCGSLPGDRKVVFVSLDVVLVLASVFALHYIKINKSKPAYVGCSIGYAAINVFVFCMAFHESWNWYFPAITH